MKEAEYPLRRMKALDHERLNRTREAWTHMSEDFYEPGRNSWQAEEPDWGIWSVKESQLGVLKGVDLVGKDVVELGCGTAYISGWLKKAGANPVGIDLTPAQLENARKFQEEFGVFFPLHEANAEDVPFGSHTFDVAISEYGASIWCDPYLWIPEAARLLRPGGWLIFLRNTPLSVMCTGVEGAATAEMQRDYFGMHRIEWNEDEPIEFFLNTGDMMRLLKSNGFEIEDLIEIQAPEGASTRYEYMTYEWAHRWPSEEVWKARKRD